MLTLNILHVFNNQFDLDFFLSNKQKSILIKFAAAFV